MRKNFASVLFFLAVGCASAQYNYSVSTTTLPPTGSSWSYGGGGQAPAIYYWSGGSAQEVKSTVYTATAPPNGTYYLNVNIGVQATPYDRFSATLYYYPGATGWALYLTKYEAGSWTNLATISVPAPVDGDVLAASFRSTDGPNGDGKGFNVRYQGQNYYARMDTWAGGTCGAFLESSYYGQQLRSLACGPLDSTAPNSLNAASLTTSFSGNTMTASWAATSDDANGIGGIRYQVFKNGVAMGTTTATNFQMPVAPGDVFTLSVKAFDAHLNYTPAISASVTVPGTFGPVDDSRRIGISGLSSQWGGMGESIDMRSMNLNYSTSLIKAVGRGISLPLGLSYNSQNWRKDGTTVYNLGADVGYGYGWRLMAGSIAPVYTAPSTIGYYLFTDSSEAEYKLDQNSSGVWSSQQSVYLWYDTSNSRLYFKNGTFWRMDSVSGVSEQDAGTRYPTLIQDSNGNQIAITYRPQIGGFTVNTSARIQSIDDIRSTSASGNVTYAFTYNSDAIPHLTGLANNINTAEAYSFGYSAAQTLAEPFANSQVFGSAVRLNSLTISGLNITQSFEYNSAVEMTRLVFPQGGEMRWNYVTQAYANNRAIREVASRDFIKASGAASVNYAFSHPGGDSSLKYHSQTTLQDPSNQGQRRWSFATGTGFSQGLETTYEELDNVSGTWTTKMKRESTWAQSSTLNPYVSQSLTTMDQGQSYQKETKTTQSIDAYGNVLTSAIYPYNNLTTALRTTTCSYANYSQYLPYVARYIMSVPLGCGTSENGSGINSPALNIDASFGGGYTMADMPAGTRLWVDPGTQVRALVLGVNDGYTSRSASYNKAGQPVTSGDNQGLSQAITYGGVGGSAVPTQITPNNNAGLGTTMSWNGFLGLTSVTSGSGTTSGFSYDSYARPASSSVPDGATTIMSYSNSPAWTLATTNNRWTKTWTDGIGRPIKVETGDSGGTKSTVDTEYDSCACSPMGKLKRVSLPYAPGGTVYWTTYAFDGLGRTLSVTQPNGFGATTYLYQGNTVKVTSPSGKWKQYEMDALGRMTQVTEPRPGGGTYLTSYTYNIAGKLTGVSMPRDGVTQTRTFNYDSTTQSRLLSATNPENGTVTYTYNADATVASKTDAKGIKTEFSYDPYKRVIQTRKSTQVSGTWTEDRCQRVDYTYDEGGGANWGKLTRTRWSWTVDGSNNVVACPAPSGSGGVLGFEEQYTYSTAGRIATKTLNYSRTVSGSTVGTAALAASWSYNNEGQVVNVTYPGHKEGNFDASRAVNYAYDSMARMNFMQTKLATVNDQNPGWQWVISGAQYNAFGAITSLTNLGAAELRNYNILGQMTRMTGPGIDVEYRFSSTQNDGKILSQKNWITGEDVVYQYDELERLISAATTAGTQSWGLSWQYDGFGNRLSQSVTQGSGPVNSVLVDGNTNRISSAGYSFDANGNMTQMPKGGGSMTLDYDLSNRLQKATNPGSVEDYRYAPDNRRVWRNNANVACQLIDGNGNLGSTYYAPGEQVIFYSPGGQKMGVYCVRMVVSNIIPGQNIVAVTASEENVYFGARLVAKRTLTNGWIPWNGLVSGFTTDRLQSKGDGSNYYPYGESRVGGGDDKEGFATYTRDAGTGLDYADQRWYASGLGKFSSPDPFEESARTVTSQSFNRYAYVESDPSNLLDPEGLAALSVPSWVVAEMRSAPSQPGTAPASPNIYNVYATICIGKRCVTSQVNTSSVMGSNPLSELGMAEKWYDERMKYESDWGLSTDAFKKKYGFTQEDLDKKLGSAGWSAFEACFDKSAKTLFTGSGGLPSFALTDSALRMADTIIAVLNRTTVGPNGERSQQVLELTLILRKLLYDDAPSISNLQSQASQFTNELFNDARTECVKKLI